MTTIEEIEGLFDDHPSLDASLQDFEQGSSELGQSPRFGMYPSHHSGFRSDDSDSEKEESLSGGGYSPPAWRRTKDGMRSSGFWRSRDNALGKRSRSSRQSSPEYESAEEGEEGVLAAAVRTRLPTGSLSPEKRRSPSPDPYPTGGGDFGHTFGAPVKVEEDQMQKSPTPAAPTPDNANNCMYHLTHSIQSTDVAYSYPVCAKSRSATPH
jgi:hypothetical protein